jgi:hypothetical protein
MEDEAPLVKSHEPIVDQMVEKEEQEACNFCTTATMHGCTNTN